MNKVVSKMDSSWTVADSCEAAANPLLTLPWACVAHDNHRLMPARGRLIATPQYRVAKHAAERIIAIAWNHRPPLTGDVVLHAWCYFPDARKRDAGNYRKLVTDAMTAICYADDAQLIRETWERAGIDRANPRIEITVEAAP